MFICSSFLRLLPICIFYGFIILLTRYSTARVICTLALHAGRVVYITVIKVLRLFKLCVCSYIKRFVSIYFLHEKCPDRQCCSSTLAKCLAIETEKPVIATNPCTCQYLWSVAYKPSICLLVGSTQLVIFVLVVFTKYFATSSIGKYTLDVLPSAFW